MRNIWSRFLVTTVLTALAVLALNGKSDKIAEDYIGQAFERALITFGLARGINAVVSVVQGTELSMEPAGVGVTLTPGEALDPLNDLIERFSWVMLLATTSLGMQEVLSIASRASILQVALLFAVAVGMLLTWRPQLIPSVAWRSFLLHLVALTLVVRFAVPGVALLNHVTYEALLADHFDDSYAALESAKDDFEAAHAEASAKTEMDGNWIDQIGSWIGRTKESLDVEKRLAYYQEKAGEATEQVVNIIVVFILTTIVFPLLFLFLGLRLLRIVGQIRWWKDG